jgi:hypothetical protein
MKKIIESSLLVYTTLSAMLGFVSFANNNVTALVGSMVLSPILSPLTNLYNPEIKVNNLSISTIDQAIYTIILLVIFVFLIGTCLGLIKNYLKIYPLETEYMKDRTQQKIIIGEFISTIVVGIGLAYATIEVNKIAKVGLMLGIVIIPILVLSGLYFANWIFIKYENLYIKVKSKKLLKDLEKYHLINCLRFFIIFIINIAITSLAFIFVSKYILKV